MQRFYSRDDLAPAIANYVYERYYPRITAIAVIEPIKDIPMPTLIGIELIKAIVLNYYGMSWEIIVRRSRKKEIVKVRNVLMYFFREKSKLSFENVGAIFGFDHSTIIHSRRKLLLRAEDDEYFRREIEYLNQAIVDAYNNQTTTR